jgi:choline dehydrogenase
MNSGGQFEYIVVGSGAGGGTLAARLAEGGRSVLLLEAGGDPRQLSGTNDDQPEINRLPDDYDVPSWHGFASENDAMRWDFFVRHYASDEMQQKDPKYRRDYRGVAVDGVLYPRAGTLGGCTAHNAMILVYPHNEDWDGIARLTGDQSWNAENMRRYFMRLENCHYRPLERALAAGGRTRRVTAGMAGCSRRSRSQRPRCAISVWCKYCSIRRMRRSTISGSRSNAFSTW